MSPMMDVLLVSMSASFVAANIAPLRQWSVLRALNILLGGIRVSTALRGSVRQGMPAESKSISLAGKFG